MLPGMPHFVDHDTRRLEVLDATWRVIARDGIDSASVRAIAREVGWSTGVLAHYFVNKDEILQAALQLAHRRVYERASRHAAESSGAGALFAALTESMPLDANRVLEAHVEVAFWGRALSSKRLNELQHDEFDIWDRFVRELVVATGKQNELASSVDIDALVAALLAVVDGAQLEAVLYPQRVSPQRQLAALETVIRTGLTPKAAAALRETLQGVAAGLRRRRSVRPPDGQVTRRSATS